MAAKTIGKAAAEAGVSIDTLRYYERQRVIPAPERTKSNYRVYSPDTVRRVRFVKRAQQLGFTLDDIRELLDLRLSETANCDDVRGRASAKLSELDRKIAALQKMHGVLSDLISRCAHSGPLSECPILDALDSEGDPETGKKQR